MMKARHFGNSTQEMVHWDQGSIRRGDGRGVGKKGLSENLEAATIELAPDDLSEIQKAAAMIPIQGARYPEALEKGTGL